MQMFIYIARLWKFHVEVCRSASKKCSKLRAARARFLRLTNPNNALWCVYNQNNDSFLSGLRKNISDLIIIKVKSIVDHKEKTMHLFIKS